MDSGQKDSLVHQTGIMLPRLDHGYVFFLARAYFLSISADSTLQLQQKLPRLSGCTCACGKPLCVPELFRIGNSAVIASFVLLKRIDPALPPVVDGFPIGCFPSSFKLFAVAQRKFDIQRAIVRCSKKAVVVVERIDRTDFSLGKVILDPGEQFSPAGDFVLIVER